ncbi:MAG: class I SAM-dependent methyltransferase [Candidatus Handelsmanbacteria bacterium]|nr:class I SAM-dependent methyltransferase [Candidatus Handelsmanbacteria bacterium]
MGRTPFAVNWLVLRLHRQHLEGALGVYGKGRLLDLGCGLQEHRGLAGGGAYVGLEVDRVRYAARPPLVWGSGMALPFGAGVFGTVLCAQVLEHVPEPAQLLGEAGRVLRNGGHLVLTAPHIWGVHEEPHDYYRFTGFGLAHLARRAGLEPVEVRPLAGYWVTAGARFCYYLQHFERGPLALLVRPLYAGVQLAAWLLDRLHRVEGDAWNFLLVARKP